MEHLHQELDLTPEDLVEVTLDHAANVLLLDPSNFLAYEQKKPYRYYGGHITQSPYRGRIPHGGKWHLVVDLGGAPGTVRASARSGCREPWTGSCGPCRYSRTILPRQESCSLGEVLARRASEGLLPNRPDPSLARRAKTCANLPCRGNILQESPQASPVSASMPSGSRSRQQWIVFILPPSLVE